MKGKTSEKVVARLKRKRRVRAHIRGTTERPRLSVFRSNRHFYAQIIDDGPGSTLVAASSQSPDYQGEGAKGARGVAAKVGLLIAQKALEKGIKEVVFDRNGFIYRKGGCIATLADAARKGGLEF